jgi:hypothetical protein
MFPIPDQGREELEMVLERVHPTALPFRSPTPFCLLLPRFYHLLVDVSRDALDKRHNFKQNCDIF